ncbi:MULTISPECIES: SHOCT domain-containing protein [Kitasatospora]|uniref:SHOCT domain-containing protein n=1 Tax=Kitasatospora cathayae TaxID=3004092 RepID=A0ABY7QAD3_9ACTN|nr:SHOCT domain-containing protein [Kitasatospora sp. HUAS 3-15]WBP89635.1 SHOCT domain-containing protein [Kitasatospora sp. HUAS 3-15]
MDTYALATSLAVDYPVLNIFWTMLELFLWILWFFLLFKIITDIFRSHDIGGWGKAGWLVLVIFLPLIGVLVYLIARGQGMGMRDIEQAQQADAAVRAYIRDAAGTPPQEGGGGRSHVEDLARLADLKAKGAISDEEYQKAKDKLLV